MLDGNCTFNVLVYADADSDVPLEWGDSDAKEIKNGEKVQLRSFSSNNHRVDTLVSYRYANFNIIVHMLGLTTPGLASSLDLLQIFPAIARILSLCKPVSPLYFLYRIFTRPTSAFTCNSGRFSGRELDVPQSNGQYSSTLATPTLCRPGSMGQTTLWINEYTEICSIGPMSLFSCIFSSRQSEGVCLTGIRPSSGQAI